MNQSRKPLWPQLRSLGNPTGLTYRNATNSQILESINNILLQQELQTYSEFEPYYLTPISRPTQYTFKGLSYQLPVSQILDPDTNKSIIEQIQELLRQYNTGDTIRVNGHNFLIQSKINRTLDEIINAIYHDEMCEITDIPSYVIPSLPDFQAYRLGELNCLLHPIKQKIQNSYDMSESAQFKRHLKTMLNKIDKLEPQFNIDGATPQLIQQLADATESKIKIYNVLTQDCKVFKADKAKRRYKFQFQNISLNHVQLWSGEYQKEIVTNINDIYNELKSNKQTFKFHIVNKRIVKIDAGYTSYIDQEYQQLLDAENEINEITDDLQIVVKTQQHDGIELIQTTQMELLQQSKSVGGLLHFGKKRKGELQHIDMEKAYSQFQNLPEQYKFGIPYMTDFRKVTSVEFAIKHNGIYQCQIMNYLMCPKFITQVLGLRTTYTLYSHVIKYLTDNGVQIQILGGMYGKHSKHITLPESSFKPLCGRKAYYTAFSKYGIQREECQQYFECSDELMVQMTDTDRTYCKQIKSHQRLFDHPTCQITEQKEEWMDQNYYSMQFLKPEKNTIKTKLHVYSYVLQSQQINMMIQLSKMDFSKVVLLCGDDIYYESHDFEMQKMFRPKGINKYEMLHKASLDETSYLRIIGENNKIEHTFGQEEPEYNQYQLHMGQGGHGKTFKRLSDIGSLGVIYTTLTNKLVDEQKQSQFNTKAYTKDKLISKISISKQQEANLQVTRNTVNKLSCSNIIIDECSLVGINTLNLIKRILPHCRVYVLGDDLQIQGNEPESNQIFDKQHYDQVFTEEIYTTDYRASNCPTLQKLKKQIRSQMRLEKPEWQIYNNLVKKYSKQITQQEFITNYTVQDIITTCSNNQKDTFTKLLQDHKKYRINSCFVQNGQKYNTGQIIYSIPDGFDYEKDQRNKKPKIALQHGYTCHSLQGTTHHHKMLVLKPLQNELFTGYCYTAVSRLTTIENLYTVQLE